MRKGNRSAKQGRNDSGAALLGDMISSEDKKRLEELRDGLMQRTQKTIEAQLALPKPPWRTPPSKTRSLESPMKKRRREEASQYTDGFRFWDFPKEAAIRERPPETISRVNRDEFDRISSAGAPQLHGTEGDLLFFTIGLDFGTSSTKVIVRLPYESGEPTVAVPAPVHCRSGDHPYLWQTVLWVRGSGEFIPYPEQGARPLYTLKQRLLGQEPGALSIQDIPEEKGVTYLNAATAYFAQVIRYVRGWLILNRPALFRGRRPVWFVNLGLPAASHANEPLVRVYRRTAAAALMLANSGEEMTPETTGVFLGHPEVEKAAQFGDEAAGLGIAVIQEVAAAATGFAKSPNRAGGLYLMVDVGAMTLDVCIFRLSRNSEGADLYPILTADVRPLGVESFYWFQSEGRTGDGFVEQCKRCLLARISKTKQRRDRLADCWKPGNKLPAFLTGGGSRNDLHCNVMYQVDDYLKQNYQNDGVRLLELPAPDTIDFPEPLADMGRMAVAWGLSYPPTDIGEIRLESDIPDVPHPGTVDYGEKFVSKDQV